MNAQSRERWLRVFLPALLTAGVYIWFYGRPGGRSLTELADATAKAHETAPKISAVVAKQDQADDLTDKVDTEKKRQQALQVKAAAMSSQRNTESRSKAVLQLSNLLAEQSLSVVSSGQADAVHGSATIQDEIVQLCKTRGLPAPHFWRVEVQGTYASVLNALKQLSARENAAVPVLIEMNAGDKKPRDPDETVQTWSVVVWI